MHSLRSVILCVTALLLTTHGAAEQQSDREARARRLLNSQGCKACHRFENTGGRVGPDLQSIGKRMNALQIRQTLVNPEHRHGESKLPDFRHLTDSELDALVSFLAGRP